MAWAVAARRKVRVGLRHAGRAPAQVSAAPRGGRRGRRAVELVLAVSRASCLDRVIIVQAYELANGHPMAYLIGTTKPSRGFEAHAWLEDEPWEGHGFATIRRVEAGQR